MMSFEDMLSSVIPFRFLSPARRAELCASASAHSFEHGELIVRQGERDDQRIYFIGEGSVEIWDEQAGVMRGEIGVGRYFGERAALFDAARLYSIRASASPTRLWSLTASAFLGLIRDEPSFAHAMGAVLRERQGLFRAFDAFLAELMHGVSHDVVHMRELTRRYRQLEPAIHAHALHDDILDFDALRYAIKRVPNGIFSYYMIYLTDDLHDHLAAPARHFRRVETAARRRVVYEMAPGKLMVVLRDGVSDLVDFVTCLCAVSVEARKMRRRMQRPLVMSALSEAVSAGVSTLTEEARGALLTRLGFDAREQRELIALWGDEVLAQLYALALHHEDYNVQITKQLQSYNSAHAELWTSQIVSTTRALLGAEPSELQGIDVHVVSSNTHSVSNCLGPYFAVRREAILEWAQLHQAELMNQAWPDEQDRLYAVARAWLRAHPGEVQLKHEMEARAGIIRLEETALTGIVVELIDLSRVDLTRIDPTLASELAAQQPSSSRKLLVNIDYAFGQQAEEILAILLTLFGSHIRSINILGKAGALQGARGDIMVATSFVEQTSDVLSDLPHYNACDAARLQARLPDRMVHVGPVLTVAGTMLQNRVLLHFYQYIWRCVGLEMEGTYYLREIYKASHLGVIPPNVALRFVYYTSDLPLAHGESLAGGMTPLEGVPPLYAITREVLRGVLCD